MSGIGLRIFAVLLFCASNAFALEAPTLTAPAAGDVLVPKPTIQWTHVEGATGYRLNFNNNDTGANIMYYNLTDLGALQIADNIVRWSGFTLQASVPYRATVTALQGSTTSSPSTPVVFQYVPPAAPTITAPVTGDVLIPKPTFQWTHVSDATGYRINFNNDETGANIMYYNLTDLSALQIADNVVTWSGYSFLRPEYRYRVTVTTLRDTATSSASVPVVLQYVLPGTPTITAPAAGNVLVPKPTFQWTHVEGATGYRLNFNNNETGANIMYYNLTDLGALQIVDNIVSWSGFTLNPALTYRVTVTTLRDTATGAPSAPIVIQYVLPGAPTILAPTTGDVLVPKPVFQWTHVSDATGYRINFNNNETGANVMYYNLTDLSALQIVDNVVSWSGYNFPANLALRVTVTTLRDTASSSPSAPVVIRYVPLTAPVISAPVSGTLGSVRQTFAWSRVEGATAYCVWLKNKDTGVNVYQTWLTVGTDLADGAVLSWNAPDLATGVNYQLTICAGAGTISGPWSAVSEFTVQIAASQTTIYRYDANGNLIEITNQ